jgi:hypothetical protein
VASTSVPRTAVPTAVPTPSPEAPEPVSPSPTPTEAVALPSPTVEILPPSSSEPVVESPAGQPWLYILEPVEILGQDGELIAVGEAGVTYPICELQEGVALVDMSEDCSAVGHITLSERVVIVPD